MILSNYEAKYTLLPKHCDRELSIDELCTNRRELQ